jgi:hypothetical protein
VSVKDNHGSGLKEIPHEKRKELGRITRAEFGLGGYQDVQLGLSVTIESSKGSWGVGDFKGGWSLLLDSSDAQWDEADRDKSYSDTMRFVDKLLTESKKSSVDKLKGTPVEVVFDGNVLVSWRVLTEVL